MKSGQINQVAVMNTAGTGLMAVAAGALTVSSSATTNQGWGSSVEWVDVLSATYNAYTAAVKPVKRVNFDATGVVIPANSAVTLNIGAANGTAISTIVGQPYNEPYQVALTVYTPSPAPTAADLAQMFYNVYLSGYASNPNLQWTMSYTAGNTFFDITTSFADNGDVNLYQYDSQVTIDGLTASGAGVTITGVSTANPSVFTATNTFAVGDILNITGLVSTTPTVAATNYSDLNGVDVIVIATNLTGSQFSVALNGTNYTNSGTWASGGTAVDKLYGVNTAMVQPVGTASQVLRDAPTMYVAGSTYNLIAVQRRKFIKSYEGLKAEKELYDIIYTSVANDATILNSTTATAAATAVFHTISSPAVYLAKL